MTTCPDPSAHRNPNLQEQASTAALYVTSPARKKMQGSPDFDVLDKNNKLSSKGAAMSLKHAKAQDLPSFPSTGGVTTDDSHDAALLANKGHKEFEHWKPDASSAAGKAALLAKDYKMAPLWQPELSAAGSKAALLAAKDGGKLNLWYPEASAEGNSAAAQAMKKGPAPAVQVVTDATRQKALLAATASLRKGRSPSGTTPEPPAYPDSHNASHNALNAATVANRQPSRPKDDYVYEDPALEQSRIKHLSDKISREMWTDNPPTEQKVAEETHQAALRASAVSMAKSMYTLSQSRDASDPAASHAGANAATSAADRSFTATPDLRQQAMQYIHLQEAAHKLAEERLAKLDPDAAERYRAHYGYPTKSPSRRKLVGRNSTRARANSDSLLDESDDERTSRRIRNQMSKFSKDLDEVDAKKRKDDRAALMAAAERKVQAQMKSIDQRVFDQTGKVSPALMAEWEAKAREKAALDSEKRTENFGKTNIGGGKFMTTAEIEAIAAARLKPTLDEITDNAEKRRARDEEIRLDNEEKKRQAAMEKQRQKEHKEIEKKNRQEEKAAAKKERQAEKDRIAEQKKLDKTSRELKSAVMAIGTGGAVAVGATAATATAAGTTAGEAPLVGEGIVEQVKDEVEHPPEAHEHDHTEGDESDDWSDANEEPDSMSPVLSRAPTGEAVLRPEIERHVTELEDSASEDEGEHEHEHDSFLPVVPETGAAAEPSAAPVESEHVGTDGPISKPVPEAAAILEANNLPGQESPRSPRRLSKLLGKFRRRSQKPDAAPAAAAAPSAAAEAKTNGAAPVLPELQVDPAALTEPAEHEHEQEDDELYTNSVKHKDSSSAVQDAAHDGASSAAHEGHADDDAETSSYVRGRPASDFVSSLGTDDGEEPEVGTAKVATSAFRDADDGEGLSKSPPRETRFQEVL